MKGLAAGQQAGLALLLEPVALALDVDDRRVVQQPVEDRRGDDLVAEDVAPAGEALVRGDEDRAALIPIFNSFPVLREQRSPSTLAILVPEAAIGRDPGAKTL